MLKLFAFFLFAFFFVEINAGRNFRLGRHVNGTTMHLPKHLITSRSITTEWFDQKLDHFTPTDQTTWKQRFNSNNQFYKAGTNAPVFIMLGGEGEASSAWMAYGAWYDSARAYGALLFQLEHRFYGASQPASDLSVENLKYLSSEQALADTAVFITAMNEKYNLTSDNKWIVFGGSYSGALAAWLRLKYPHLIHGASSASGPVLAQVDFQNYFRVVGESLATHSQECVDAVKEGVAAVESIIDGGKAADLATVDNLFSTCTPLENSISNEKDINTFFEGIADNFAGVVQYNLLSLLGIEDVCDIMANESNGTPIERLGAVNTLMLKSNSASCLDYRYEDVLKMYADISISNSAMWRQWTWQTCTEFGYYQTSSYEKHIFGDKFPIKYFIDMCTDIFGDVFNDKFINDAIDNTNTDYGGLELEASNIVYVHGTIDPWHALGIFETVDESSPAILINGTAHCANMYSPSAADLPELNTARNEVHNLIGTWLGLK